MHKMMIEMKMIKGIILVDSSKKPPLLNGAF